MQSVTPINTVKKRSVRACSGHIQSTAVGTLNASEMNGGVSEGVGGIREKGKGGKGYTIYHKCQERLPHSRCLPLTSIFLLPSLSSDFAGFHWFPRHVTSRQERWKSQTSQTSQTSPHGP